MTQKLGDVWRALPTGVRRTLVAVAGGSVVCIGVLMVLTPGPAVLVIPLGLSILAAEFAWARRWIQTWVPESWQPNALRSRRPAVGRR